MIISDQYSTPWFNCCRCYWWCWRNCHFHILAFIVVVDIGISSWLSSWLSWWPKNEISTLILPSICGNCFLGSDVVGMHMRILLLFQLFWWNLNCVCSLWRCAGTYKCITPTYTSHIHPATPLLKRFHFTFLLIISDCINPINNIGLHQYMHNNDFHSLWCKSLNLAGRCWTAERERSVASTIFCSIINHYLEFSGGRGRGRRFGRSRSSWRSSWWRSRRSWGRGRGCKRGDTIIWEMCAPVPYFGITHTPETYFIRIYTPVHSSGMIFTLVPSLGRICTPVPSFGNIFTPVP